MSSAVRLPWAVAAFLLVAAGVLEIADGRWNSPWPISLLTLLLLGLTLAVVTARPIPAATLACLALGVECLLWSTPQSFAALVAFLSIAAGAARYAPSRALLPVLGLVALTVVVVLVPDPGEDATFDYVLTSLLCAVATGGGLLARSGQEVLQRASTTVLRPLRPRPGPAGAAVAVPGARTVATVRPAVYLHIGLPKTGTSYLQSICTRSEGTLAEQGLALLPRKGTTAFQVMLDVRDELRAELDPPEHFGALDRLGQDAAALSTPRALVSQELFSLASAEQAGRLVQALGDVDVHLVVTVRDLARQLPSLWQQQVKARGVTSYEAFLDRVTSDDSGQARGYDLVAVLQQWRDVVPPERTHVVTVPRPGSATGLPMRFFGLLGVDPAKLDTEQGEGNLSLGMTQAELLRRVNVALGKRLPHARAGYRGPGKRFLAETILIQQEGPRPSLPARLRPWVEERSREVVEELRSYPYDVVGDLEELLPDPTAFAESHGPVTDAELVDSATEALAAVLVDRAESRDRKRTPRRD